MTVIFELEGSEKEWWVNTVRSYRSEIVRGPREYVELVVESDRTSVEDIKNNISDHVRDIRDKCWRLYLRDEVRFHKQVIKALLVQRDVPKEILDESISEEFGDTSIEAASDEFRERLASLVGDFAGKLMPYLFYLGKSTSNSRRSRAGQTFEALIEYVFDIFTYPYNNQSKIGKAFYEKQGIGKIVDVIVPSKKHYARDRAKCMVVTMKTTLRERWQEVVEELNRTNMPHVFLLTLDNDLTRGVVESLRAHNITIATYDWISASFPNQTNVMSFEQFFKEEVPHCLSYWEGKA